MLMKTSAPSSLFALIIGINSYKSKIIQSLRGAVADARAVATYLQDRLDVPQDHIAILENESATRTAIIGQLQHIATDPRIQRGDPILIFYAGHGSEAAAPAGWEAGGSNANIQLTLPYDAFCESEKNTVAPIPDRTFGVLLEAIAQEKGNNIVVVMDSCYSASGMRFDPSDSVRSVPLPSYFKLQENLDQDMWSLCPTNGGLRSHVLLSACGPSGQARESNGRGTFTVALLDLLENSRINKLRYCDIIRRIDIDSNQSPHCEGVNRERYIFTTTSPPIEYFIPAYTRIEKNGRIAYVLNGGAAHGLVVGDEFAIYSDMDYPVSEGTLIVDELGPFYSIMRLAGNAVPITSNTVAIRVKEGKRPPLRICSRPGDKLFEILSVLDNDHDFTNSNIVRLARILKASRQFFSELDRTANFPDITDHVQVEMHELHGSECRFPGHPMAERYPLSAAPYQSDSFTMRQGASYGLELINNSHYDLYPIVQYFTPSSDFKFNTWYRPACSRSMLDVPLKKHGGSLAIGYGFGGPPFVTPFAAKETIGFLKISLFTRPLDPFYQAQSFHFARYLPAHFKGPWATIVKQVNICQPLAGCPQEPAIGIFSRVLNTKGRRSIVFDQSEKRDALSIYAQQDPMRDPASSLNHRQVMSNSTPSTSRLTSTESESNTGYHIPGYRHFFSNDIAYQDLTSILAPIVRPIVYRPLMWTYTGDFAKRTGTLKEDPRQKICWDSLMAAIISLNLGKRG